MRIQIKAISSRTAFWGMAALGWFWFAATGLAVRSWLGYGAPALLAPVEVCAIFVTFSLLLAAPFLAIGACTRSVLQRCDEVHTRQDLSRIGGVIGAFIAASIVAVAMEARLWSVMPIPGFFPAMPRFLVPYFCWVSAAAIAGAILGYLTGHALGAGKPESSFQQRVVPSPIAPSPRRKISPQAAFRSIAALGWIIPWGTALAVRTWLGLQGRPVVPWSWVIGSSGLLLIFSIFFAFPFLVLAFWARSLLSHRPEVETRRSSAHVGALIGALSTVAIGTVLLHWELWINIQNLEGILLAPLAYPLATIVIAAPGLIIGYVIGYAIGPSSTTHPPLQSGRLT